ncbi:MAG: hypothetical protein Q9163_000862 [Psora crenata]
MEAASFSASSGNMKKACEWAQKAMEMTASYAGTDYEGYKDVQKMWQEFIARRDQSLRGEHDTHQQKQMANARVLNPRFIQAGHIKVLNSFIEGASSCLRDENMLESAVNSPADQQHYGQVHNPARLAAALSYRLIKNHAFANGNKRTALLAVNAFLLQYGEALNQQDASKLQNNEAVKQAHDDVAMGKLEESELAEIYRRAWQTYKWHNRES